MILIVDDYDDTRLALKRLVGSHGHTVECSDNGRSALQIARSRALDVIVLDATMPGVTGLDVLRELRLNPETKNVRVVFFSAMDDPAMVQQAKALGAIDWILKGPHGWQQLLQRIDALSPAGRETLPGSGPSNPSSLPPQ